MRQIRERRLLVVTCLGLWLGMVAFGLWPFNFNPRNRVGWLPNGGIALENYGEAYSQSQWNHNNATLDHNGVTVELWVLSQEKNYHQVSGLFSVADARQEYFTIAQSGPDVMVRAQFQEGTDDLTVRHFYIDDAFPQAQPRFIAVTSGPNETDLYLDGIPKRKVPFTLSRNNFRGKILLGHNFVGHEDWAGSLLGLAVYDRALTGAQVSKDYSAWQGSDKAELMSRPEVAALYLFDEKAGNVIHNQAGDAPNVIIPERFSVLHKTFLIFPQALNRANLDLSDIVVNILGFVPFGFSLCALLRSGRHPGVGRSILLTVALGAITSLTIELLQAYLPSRESSFLDLIDNTLGTLVGAVLQCKVTSVISWARRAIV